MPEYTEYCPLGLTDKEITFTVNGREPSPTNGCICGGTEAEKNATLAAGTATAANLTKALGDSILSGGKPCGVSIFRS